MPIEAGIGKRKIKRPEMQMFSVSERTVDIENERLESIRHGSCLWQPRRKHRNGLRPQPQSLGSLIRQKDDAKPPRAPPAAINNANHRCGRRHYHYLLRRANHFGI